jgi:hypothetical protein
LVTALEAEVQRLAMRAPRLLVFFAVGFDSVVLLRAFGSFHPVADVEKRGNGGISAMRYKGLFLMTFSCST